jgi:MerR HTH family regulatory protein
MGQQCDVRDNESSTICMQLCAEKCDTMNLDIKTFAERQRLAHETFPLISIQEVARTYNISVRQLRRWEGAGLMPPRTKHGHRWKYQKVDIAEFMASRGKERRSKSLPDPRSATMERRRALRRGRIFPHVPANDTQEA